MQTYQYVFNFQTKVLAFLNKANETFYIVVFNILYVCLRNAYEGC